MVRLTCRHIKCAGRNKFYGLSTFLEHLAYHNMKDNNGNDDVFAFRCDECGDKFVTRLHAEEHAFNSQHIVYPCVTEIAGKSFGGVAFAKLLKSEAVQVFGEGQGHAVRQQVHQQRMRNNPRNEERERHNPKTPGYYTPKTPGVYTPKTPGVYAPKTPRTSGVREEERGSRVRRPQTPALRRGDPGGPVENSPEPVQNRQNSDDVEDEVPVPPAPPPPADLRRKRYTHAVVDVSTPKRPRRELQAGDIEDVQEIPVPPPPPPPAHLRRNPDTPADISPPKGARDLQGTGAHSTDLPGKNAAKEFQPVPPPEEAIVRMTKRKNDAKNIPPPPFSSNDVGSSGGRQKAAEKQPEITKGKKPAHQVGPKKINDDNILILEDQPPRPDELIEQHGRKTGDKIIIPDTASKIPQTQGENVPAPPPRPPTPQWILRHISIVPRPPRRPSPPPITRGSPDYEDDQRRPRRRSDRHSRDGRSRSRNNSRHRSRSRRDRRSPERAQAARKKADEDSDIEVTYASNDRTFRRDSGQRPPKNLVPTRAVPEVPHRKQPSPPKRSRKSKEKSPERSKERNKDTRRRKTSEERDTRRGKDRGETDRRPMRRSRADDRVKRSPMKKASDKKLSQKRERSYSHSPRSATP